MGIIVQVPIYHFITHLGTIFTNKKANKSLEFFKNNEEPTVKNSWKIVNKRIIAN